jgi:pantothenate kinase type III
MVKSKKSSVPPLTVWPEAAPSPGENKIFSISIGNSHISWCIHESVAKNLVPTLFWRTPKIEIDKEERNGTNCEILSTYLCDGAREIVFGSKSADPTLQNAIRASAERRVSILSIYVVSTNDVQLKTLYSILAEIPCRVYRLKGDDFYSKKQGRYDGMGIDRLANLRAAGDFKGYPALVFDGGTAMTYTAADENGKIMGGGIGPGIEVQMDSLFEFTAALPQMTHEDIIKRVAKLEDKDGNVVNKLPVFAKTTEDNIVTKVCLDISRSGQFVIEQFLHETGGSETNESEINHSADRVILVTGGDAPLIERLIAPDCPLIKSFPSTTASSPPKYKVEVMKHMIHHGVASVLREHVKEFEKSTSAELDTLLIGQRVAKQFPMSDQDGDHVYRGSVACVHGGGPGFPYGIRYDDGDTEDMNAVELYEAMELYIQVGEKDSYTGESSRESQPRQPPIGAKISGAQNAASKLATKDKAVEEYIQGKKRAQQSKTSTRAPEPTAKAAAVTQAAKDDTVKKPAVEPKKRGRPPKNKTPASGAEPPKQVAKKPKNAPPGLKKADEEYVGDRVAKDFDNKLFFGTVKEVWYDKKSRENLWLIKYDDSDEEDVYRDDLVELLNYYEKEKHNDDKKASK